MFLSSWGVSPHILSEYLLAGVGVVSIHVYASSHTPVSGVCVCVSDGGAGREVESLHAI